MNSRSKHQHWVPQFYLRYFATPATRNSDNAQIWMFSKEPDDGDEKLTSVRNVCGMRHLYSPKLSTGERTWQLDDKLNDIESLLAPLWPALATDFIDLNDEDFRKGLALFVSVQYLRHPEIRGGVEVIHKELTALYESIPKTADGTPDIESFEVKGKSYPLDTSDWHSYKTWGKDEHDLFFTKFVQSEVGNMAKRLRKKRWSVLFSEDDVFVTTDKPVLLQHQTRERFGFGTQGTIVMFPLSPTRLLVMDDLHHEPANQYYPLATSNAGSFNFSMWHGASRFLLTGRSIETVLAEICEISNSQRTQAL